MIKSRTMLAAALAVGAMTLPATAQAGGYYVEAPGKVVGVAPYDVLNVRAWPAHYSRKVGYLAPFAHGFTVERCVKKPKASDWCKVHHGGLTGWVNSRYIAWW